MPFLPYQIQYNWAKSKKTDISHNFNHIFAILAAIEKKPKIIR